MNYPDLIWRLIEMVLQKEKEPSQKIDEALKDNILNAKKPNETE